jgi:molecular chaperone GrpE
MDKNAEKKYPSVSVGGLIINKNGKTFLAKGKRWGNKYTIIGGKVELGESLKEALLREMKEEAGIEVEIIQKISCGESIFHEKDKKNKHVLFIDYLCFYDGGDDDIQTNEEFTDEFIWVDPVEALKLDLAPDVDNVIKKYIDYKEKENYLYSWKRCQADFENFKKDQAKHQEEFRKYAKMNVIEQILPVVDNFEASLAHVPEKSQENKWVEGIVYIKKQLEDVLKNNDIEEIAVKEGDKFNPEIHEAIGGDGKKQKVAKVIQKGYGLNGRILRAARVEVE